MSARQLGTLLLVAGLAAAAWWLWGRSAAAASPTGATPNPGPSVGVTPAVTTAPTPTVRPSVTPILVSQDTPTVTVGASPSPSSLRSYLGITPAGDTYEYSSPKLVRFLV